MLTLHLVRHGETLEAKSGVFCGEIDPPLSALGEVQAERLAQLAPTWDLVAAYVSPKRRARATLEPTARALGLEPRVESGLRELFYGAWEGQKEADVHMREPQALNAWVSDPAHVPPGGSGETGVAIRERALPVIERIRESHPSGAVVVVSHKATIRVLVCTLLGIDLRQYRSRLECLPASVTSFVFEPHGPRLFRLNDTNHLADR